MASTPLNRRSQGRSRTQFFQSLVSQRERCEPGRTRSPPAGGPQSLRWMRKAVDYARIFCGWFHLPNIRLTRPPGKTGRILLIAAAIILLRCHPNDQLVSGVLSKKVARAANPPWPEKGG